MYPFQSENSENEFYIVQNNQWFEATKPINNSIADVFFAFNRCNNKLETLYQCNSEVFESEAIRFFPNPFYWPSWHNSSPCISSIIPFIGRFLRNDRYKYIFPGNFVKNFKWLMGNRTDNV